MLAGPVLADVAKRMKRNFCNWGCWETSNGPSTNGLLFPINSIGTTCLVEVWIIWVLGCSKLQRLYVWCSLNPLNGRNIIRCSTRFHHYSEWLCRGFGESVAVDFGSEVGLLCLPYLVQANIGTDCLKCCSLNHRIHIASCFGTSVNRQLLNFPRKKSSQGAPQLRALPPQ